MIIVNICQGHCMSAVRTAKWVISERKEYVVAPHGKAADSFTLGFMNCKGKGLIFSAMAGIQTVIAADIFEISYGACGYCYNFKCLYTFEV